MNFVGDITMHNKNIRAFLPILALAMLLIGLSGCGTNASALGSAAETPTVPGNAPDRVQITLGNVVQPNTPSLTLTDTSLAQQLYTTALALPHAPTNLVCTDELGQSYTLIFLHGAKTLTMMVAQRYSCQIVTTKGSQQQQQATPDFWKLVDQAVFAATPAAQPQWLAILHTLQGNQPPLTARITSTTTTRQLYQAILALPLASPKKGCNSSASAYSLLFHTANLALPVSIDDGCNTVNLNGQWRARGGSFMMTDAFKTLLTQTLNGASYAPAQPDQLSLNLQPGNSTSSQRTITNVSLIQQLYRKAFALPAQTQPYPSACTSGEDKVKGTGEGYTFNFSQWGLPLLYLFAHEGSCTMVTLGDSNQPVQGDSEFWKLVHQAANS